MALARFRDLCIDAVDVEVMSRFYADLLGLELEEGPRGGRLTGPTPQHTIWVNQVAEPKTVKQRVHLDVHATSDHIEGATPISAPGEFRWRVMADPEGGELCVFTRDEVSAYRLYEVVVDSADHVAQAAWWGEVLDVAPQDSGEEFAWLEEVPGMPFECLVFGDVPEPKTVKNRIHWDVQVDEPDALEELVRRGARILREPDDDIDWFVLADPEGNEFCVFGA
jgi:hypothetical protein